MALIAQSLDVVPQAADILGDRRHACMGYAALEQSLELSSCPSTALSSE